MSSIERFIFPFSSSNMRSFEIFAASASASAVLSPAATPSRMRSPLPQLPVTLPFTVTSADLTRCNTTIIVSLLEDQLMNPRVTSITSASERSRDTIEL